MEPRNTRKTRNKLPARTAALLVVMFLVGCDRGGQPVGVQKPEPPASKAAAAKNIPGMALIPAGEFLMGDNNGDEDEKPTHKVRVSAFYMDTTEVSQKAYENLMEKNPSKFKAPDKPVEQVDWYHAVLYCNLRSLKEGLKPCYDAKTLACDFAADGYRLPTEAEWEYACRAGTQTKYSVGDDPAKLRPCAWLKANASQTTHPVGQKAPNPWGLFDMHGNVAEWCQDVYSASHYQKNEGTDPRGPDAGEKRVLRGGSWRTSEDSCRSSARNSENGRFADACFGSDAYGFRCVRACLKIAKGAAARDWGWGQGGETGASPQRAVTVEPTPAPARSPAAWRVFAAQAVGRRCSSVTDRCGYAPVVAPCHPAFPAKTVPLGIFKQALKKGTLTVSA